MNSTRHLSGNDYKDMYCCSFYFKPYSINQSIVFRVDEFDVESPYVGPIEKVHIEHDNSGFGPAWYLDKVTVQDLKRGHTFEFPCDRWLATNADDGAIARDLVCVAPPEYDKADYEIKVKKPKIKAEAEMDADHPRFGFHLGGKKKEKEPKGKKEKKPKGKKEKDVTSEEDAEGRHGFSINMPSFGFKKGKKGHYDVTTDGDDAHLHLAASRPGTIHGNQLGLDFSMFIPDFTLQA